MTKSIKNIAITGMGIALFVILSLCLQVPIFENYYLCLGYIAMTVYIYLIGGVSGTIVGVAGVILYCLLINGLRGMPGWALGNLVLGILMSLTIPVIKKIKNPLLEFILNSVVIIIVTAIAILVFKSELESILYAQPFLVRAAKNIYAFVADAFVIIASLPLCKLLKPHIKRFL